jgi:Ca-activated chloride channel family protein
MTRRPAWFPAPLGTFLSLQAFTLASLCAAVEPPPAAAPPPDPGTGAMYANSAAGLVPLPNLSIDAEVRVTGILVQGTLRQTFTNDSDRVIEALYVFPLPERAAVDSFELRVGDRIVRSTVRERVEARATYEAAKASGQKAGLVEFARRGLFKTSISGINPGESVAVALNWFDEAAWSEGEFSFALPLTWTPRFSPDLTPPVPRTSGSEGCFVPAAAPKAPRFSVRVSLDPGFEAAAIVSPSHRITVTGGSADGDADSGGASYTIATVPGVPPDRDFRLTWRPVRNGRPTGTVFVEPRADGLYALALILPGDPGAPTGVSAGSAPANRDDPGLPTRTLFIVDVSGSMEGPSLAQAKEALIAALDRLGPADLFNILKFSSGSAPWRDTFQSATPTRIHEATAWVRALGVEGGTEILEALRHAGTLIESEPSRMVTRAILITDGAVDADDAAIAAATRGLGETRLHAVGIGPAPNRPLMRALARQGRGATEFIGSIDEVGTRLGGFLDRIRRPVLADLSITWDGLPPLDTRPERIPDLHSGEPLLVSLRFDPSARGTQGVLRGVTAGGPFETPLAIAPDAPQGAGIATRWARARIADLLDGLASGRSADAVRAAVLPIAIEHSLVTPYTSLVAVEERVTANGASTPAEAASVAPGSAGDGSELVMGGTDNPFWLRLGVVFLAFGLALALVRRFLP